MGRGILRGAGGDENLKSNFIWPYYEICYDYLCWLWQLQFVSAGVWALVSLTSSESLSYSLWSSLGSSSCFWANSSVLLIANSNLALKSLQKNVFKFYEVMLKSINFTELNRCWFLDIIIASPEYACLIINKGSKGPNSHHSNNEPAFAHAYSIWKISSWFYRKPMAMLSLNLLVYYMFLWMKERVSKLTYPTLQHCLRMLHTMNGNSKH